MLDIGWTELLVIAVVLIVVVGPKDLPPMLRAFGKMTSNLRKMAGDFRTQFDEALKEADMDDVRQTIGDAKRFHPANAIREAINPLREMGNEIRNDLQKVTEFPNSSSGEPEQGQVTASVDDLIPAPAFSLPDTPPIAPAPVAAPSVSVANEAAKPTTASAPVATAPSTPVVGTPASPVQAPSSASEKPSEVVVKPTRTRKPSTAKLVAPAVPAIVSADAIAHKKPRSRKAAAIEQQISGGNSDGAKASAKGIADSSFEAASAGQLKTPTPRKKKSSASKDQT